MKHLKTYNESFRSNSILRDIMDISLDIQDDGFRVTPIADKLISPGYSDFHITIDKFDGFRRFFDIDEVKDFLLRVFEYGKISPCEIKIFIPEKNHTNQRIEIKPNKYGNFTPLDRDWAIDYRVTYVDVNVRPFI